jgi:N-acetylglucosaminylphosphatidylinositol deacetylase
MLKLALLVLPLLVAILFNPLYSNPSFSNGESSDQSPRILLLTAHPDDEVAFFAPTLLALRTQVPPVDVYSLCLSTGDADGLGEMRVKEHQKAHDVLGIDPGKTWILDNPYAFSRFLSGRTWVESNWNNFCA